MARSVYNCNLFCFIYLISYWFPQDEELARISKKKKKKSPAGDELCAVEERIACIPKPRYTTTPQSEQVHKFTVSSARSQEALDEL